MKNFISICVLMCLFFALSLIVSAQNKAAINEKDVEELKTIYVEFDEAAKNQDSKALEKYLDENYILESGTKRLNKKQALNGMRDYSGMIRGFTLAQSRIEKIEKIGSRYIMTVTFFSAGKVQMPSGRILDFTTTTKSTDFWHKDRKGQWRQSMQISRETDVFIDPKKLEG
ncbi:MAG TPA: DUF4440 domain-containing protein [Pyrinomonadaceae bacterium]|nr:DUF4440 domain-containing protein [Pyrinomonadaceae bacterium]